MSLPTLSRLVGCAPSPRSRPRREHTDGRSSAGRRSSRSSARPSISLPLGRGSVFLITGEPGIGKTRLMQEFADVALEPGLARPRRTLLGGGRRARRTGRGSRSFERPAVSSNGWRRHLPTARSPGRRRPRQRPLPALRRRDPVPCSRPRALRPLVIVLDDLHAADAPRSCCSASSAERSTRSRLLVLGSYREGESRVHELATTLRRARSGRQAGPAPRTEHGRGRGLRRARGRRGLTPDAARLHAITGGNPFFLGEVMRLLSAGGLLGEADEARQRPDAPGTRRKCGASSAVAWPASRTRRSPRWTLLPSSAASSTSACSSTRVDLGPERLLDVVAEAVEAGHSFWKAPGQGATRSCTSSFARPSTRTCRRAGGSSCT